MRKKRFGVEQMIGLLISRRRVYLWRMLSANWDQWIDVYR